MKCVRCPAFLRLGVGCLKLKCKQKGTFLTWPWRILSIGVERGGSVTVEADLSPINKLCDEVIMHLHSCFCRGYTHYSCLRSRGRLNMRGMRSIGARLSRLCVCRSSRLAYLVRNGLPSFIAAILPLQTKPGANTRSPSAPLLQN